MEKFNGREVKYMNDKSGLQFIDTNILVYSHDISAGEKNLKAKSLLTDLWNSRKGCLSIQVLQEFYVTVTKKVAAPVNSEFAAQIISDLSCWKIHAPKVNDILNAIDIKQRFCLSFWDSLIIVSAKKLNCEIIWSEDLNSGQVFDGIKVMNPF